MLIELFGENFGCFRDEFRLSLLATDIDPGSNRGVAEVAIDGDPAPLRLLRAAAIYGPNASGKSTILRAANVLRHLIVRSARFRSDEQIDYYEPFAGDESKSRPVKLGMKAVIDGAVYDYEVSYTDTSVVAERLERQTGITSTVLVDRHGQEVSGEWTEDEQFLLATREFRPNALLLSLADALTPKLAQRIAPGLSSLLRFFDGAAGNRVSPFTQPAAQLAKNNPAFKEWLLQQLRAADIGVTDLSVKQLRRVEVSQGFLFEEINEGADAAPTEMVRHRLAFRHAGPSGTFAVPYDNESFGTKKLVELAPVLFRLFAEGGSTTSFVDEIGASLHPTLLVELIRHINCSPRSSDARGQLIFATHETSLIDDEARDAVLRRDQVYFAAKDTQGVGRLYALSDFQERQNINLRKRYLEGRYGAIPSLGPFPTEVEHE
ncbi:MAG TPA: AAA family ATPase [Tepidisphaeraceae bacterium]|nr:AAA family ATPase [Tepidisphaeraceae bacterium]